MPNKAKRQNFRSALLDAWHHKRGVMLVYIFLRLSVILVLVAQLFNRNFENVFLCVLVLFLFSMPSMLEKRLSIDLPDTLEIIILLFIYAAEIMGEIGAYYIKHPYWDTALHTLNGFLCAAIGFSLLDLLNRQKINRGIPKYTSILPDPGTPKRNSQRLFPVPDPTSACAPKTVQAGFSLDAPFWLTALTTGLPIPCAGALI